MLSALSQKLNITMAEALHLALTNPQALREQIKKGEDDAAV